MRLLKRIYKNINIIKDFVLNLFSNFLIILITQLFIFPKLSNSYNEKIFGIITSLYGINSVIIVLTGDSLANVRLINNNKNGENYNILSLLDSVILSFVSSIILFLIYGNGIDILDLIIFSFTTCLMSYLQYGISLYRIHFKYNLFLLQNFIIFIGYIIGFFIFKLTNHWSFIFLIGNVLGLLFFIFSSGVRKDVWKVNNSLSSTLHSLINISIGHVASSLLSNLDRFLIPVLLGSSYLSPFFAANTISKMFNLIIGPLSDVLLSYLSKSYDYWNKKRLNYFTLVLMIIGMVLIIPSYIISNIIMKILYDNIYLYYYSNIKFIIFLSCIATSIFGIWNILNTIYLVCLKSKFQIYINMIFLIMYILFSSIFSVYFGLLGFVIGYTITIILGVGISVILSNINFFWKNNKLEGYNNEKD